MLSFFPRDVLDEILNLIESVSEGFPPYSSVIFVANGEASFLGKLILVLIPSAYTTVRPSRAPGLFDRVFAVHAGSRGFSFHRRHTFELIFRLNRTKYPHSVYSELENSGIRVTGR